jgi:hypothetical protein
MNTIFNILSYGTFIVPMLSSFFVLFVGQSTLDAIKTEKPQVITFWKLIKPASIFVILCGLIGSFLVFVLVGITPNAGKQLGEAVIGLIFSPVLMPLGLLFISLPFILVPAIVFYVILKRKGA